MSLGLTAAPTVAPATFAAHTGNRSLAKATRVLALVCLVGAFLLVESLQLSHPERTLWPALLALVPVGIQLWQLDRLVTVGTAVGYLAVGAICLVMFSAVVTSEVPIAVQSGTFPLALAKIALIMVAGPAHGIAGELIWPLAGFVLAEFATRLGVLLGGGILELDVTALVALLCVMAVRLISDLVSHPNTLAHNRLHAAARNERAAEERSRVESRASALLHDTVLSDLASVAVASPGTVDAYFEQQMRRDLELLAGGQWISGESAAGGVAVGSAATSPDWEHNALHATIKLMRDLGLDVVVTGDVTVLAQLTPERGAALALAAHQCLVNVVKHSGTRHAEVVLARSACEVSVMIVDGGRGFTVTEARPDRLGLRQSVRRRVEEAGGSVHIWSTPGAGTSIMLLLPIGETR